jgi:sensor histidine kinase YesM
MSYGATQGGPKRLDLSLSSVRLDGKDYIQVISTAKQADLCVVQLLPRNEISRLLPAATRVLMILSFAALLLIPLLMLAIQKLVITPINKLLDAMEHIDQGDLEYRIDTAKTYGSEFDALNRHFNYTMDEVKDLKIRVYEEKLKAQKIHLRFLSQQIRPHFILNTLNILYSYEKEDFPLIQRMILCLSRYFRYVVNANEDYVLLGQEIEHIRNYFEIQQARFLRTFQSEIVCDESLYNCMIPPLLIQSFAENAIKYALRPGEVISIAIRAEATADERLHISVIDNGTGISAEALEMIQRFVQKREYQKDLGVGIQNAIDRMDLLYHGEGHVQVSKNEPRGTRVDIVMPIQRKELSDDECDFD